MAHDALHQPFPQAVPAIRFQHKHIADVGVGCVVRDYASKAHLLTVAIHSKAERILDGPDHNLARDSLGPIRLRQKTVDDIQIKAVSISADDEPALAVLCDLSLAGF